MAEAVAAPVRAVLDSGAGGGERRPLVVGFSDLVGVTLRATVRSRRSESAFAELDVWLDLLCRDGRKEKWRAESFADDLRTIQGFIEAYAVHGNSWSGLPSRPSGAASDVAFED
ncbi:hypothetical protein [Streptomyces alkaliterrae]|uniref:Uncharacterized protein n=1 Tax=Streptomyces alkaliterrae TaxID=2213162 RepID=A0A5P0YWT4_9ACTN|nr:hypothetical protein [Streptomyces alkaliterrae]MBB1254273.1 hypothetical protein [Streptomyces alkaliterrae]MBB1261477.1 hypothetical protein [Streptomyces alkaliterrae]MQS04736.1 hypothetical protein [Streptomyces alkaliterrae]